MPGEGAVLAGAHTGGSAGGKKKPSGTKIVLYSIGGAIVAYLAYYLYEQHVANAAANTAATTPSTVDTTPSSTTDTGGTTGTTTTGAATTGLGSIDPLAAIDPATGLAYADEPGGTAYVDPATGLSVEQELQDLGLNINPFTGQPIVPVTGSLVSPGSTVATAPLNVAQWRAKVLAALESDRVPAAAAESAVSNYLNGNPITSGTAAQGIANQLSIIGGVPGRGAASLPIIVAKGVKLPTAKPVAQPYPTGSTPTPGPTEVVESTPPALAAAEATLARETKAGNKAGIKNATANVATVKKNLASRT